MNSQTSHAANRALNQTGAPFQYVPATSRPTGQRREFGVGYGSSSGYATPRRYAADLGPRLFRLA